MKNIIIFGASKFGEKVFNYYQKDADINILSFCDNDVNKHSTLLFGKKIISPSKLLETDFDEIVIASSYEKAIQEQLFDMKIDKEKIKIFHTNFEEIQLKNENLLAISESLMFDIAQLFNENNINYHIDHGTLLGLIRDSQILPWDIDIDFAILFD
ncbi:MAG: LicD family protein, partial [Campylobacterales bacterium]|nr:LicD family protein [Campylobacterales bacterium]